MSDVPTHNGKPAESDNPPSAQQVVQGGQSGNYTPPATQAELDRIIADRLSRERQKFADYDELKTAARRLAELEEASKSEDQKRAERIAELEATVAEYQTRDQIAAWKAEVAKATGVPAEVLAGSTKEDIEAHAATLKPLIVPADGKKGAIGPYVPSEGTGEGALPLNGDPLERALRTKLGIA